MAGPAAAPEAARIPLMTCNPILHGSDTGERRILILWGLNNYNSLEREFNDDLNLADNAGHCVEAMKSTKASCNGRKITFSLRIVYFRLEAATEPDVVRSMWFTVVHLPRVVSVIFFPADSLIIFFLLLFPW